MLLGDLGADVIKVEECSRGDDTRMEFPVATFAGRLTLMCILLFGLGSWSPPSAPVAPDAPPESAHLPPESAYFLSANRNKRSITANFKHPDGLALMRKLVARADVLVENYVPGKLAQLGLGYEECRALNPRLIYTSITGKLVRLCTSEQVCMLTRIWTDRAVS